LDYFCETNLIKVIPFHTSIFFSKNYSVSRFGCQITLFTAKNRHEINIFRKMYWQISTENLSSFNTRFWPSQSDHKKRNLQKLDLLSSPSNTFYLWKRTKQWTSRELFIIQESPLDVSISTFGDLYCNQYVWLQQHVCLIGTSRKFGLLCVKRQYCLF